ncbi:unnamed protein product [Malus baccata var. baccata]
MFDDVEAGTDVTPKDESKGEFEFVSKRQFEEFSMTMEVRLRTVVKALEEEQRARMKLVAELERLQSDGQSDWGKNISHAANLPTFDVDLLEIIEAKNANDVAQSLLRIMQFRLVHPFTPIESYKGRKVSDDRLIEDFFVVLKPMWIILKPDVEVFIDVLTHWVGS